MLGESCAQVDMRMAGSDAGIHEALSSALGLPVTLARASRAAPRQRAAAPGHDGFAALDACRRAPVPSQHRLRIVEPTERCVMTTFAQAELPADPSVLKRIVRDADLRLGVYAEALAEGAVRCGDRVAQVAD